MPILRAFIAVELNDAVKAGLEQLQRRLRAEPISGFVRWVAPSSMHLTLKFLGDVDSTRVPHLLAAMKTASAGVAPFDLAVRGAGCFPNSQRPNVVWAGLAGDVQAVTLLARRLEDACAELGFEPEERSFSPHLTLGRVSREAGSSERQQIGDLVRRLNVSQVGQVHASVVHLMRSELRPAGALYSSLGSVKLS